MVKKVKVFCEVSGAQGHRVTENVNSAITELQGEFPQDEIKINYQSSEGKLFIIVEVHSPQQKEVKYIRDWSDGRF